MHRPRIANDEQPADRCYLSAMRILNYRFNSEAELRRKLVAKEFERDVIEATLGRLRDEGWLDDVRFAAAFVRTRQLKKIGPRRIARELRAAGIDDEIAAAAISENTDEEGQRDAVLAVCRKRAVILARRKGAEYATSPEARNKLTAYLLNQGYDGALAREAVRAVLKEI